MAGPLTDCSIIMYVMTERLPTTRKYRDVFEEIKEALREMIARNIDNRRLRFSPFSDGVRERCRGLELGFNDGAAREEFSWMINDMTGRRRSSAAKPVVETPVQGGDVAAMELGDDESKPATSCQGDEGGGGEWGLRPAEEAGGPTGTAPTSEENVGVLDFENLDDWFVEGPRQPWPMEGDSGGESGAFREAEVRGWELGMS